ncbi:Non-specific serine/threonine protein kinase [Handroanthus impetiginosus]|uniref:Non-specific serine/threonine protein kinase n=1 Tax=Handroanthus impetiginosus TaxID=429701 RepID=A0A2G9G9N2_9LAMI|nr:Non-specific serine/threonine protein kinase [Handroanthus impetiginosus]
MSAAQALVFPAMALDLLATVHFLDRKQSNSSSENESLEPTKRVSWNRSLSTRGRTSIAATASVDQPKQRKPRRNAKPPLPRGEAIQPANYDKERAYFQEVDAFELLQECPSPEKPAKRTPGKDHLEVRSSSSSAQQELNSILNNKLLTGMPIQETCEDIKSAVNKSSLTSRSSSLDGHDRNSFSALLTACRQSVLSTLTDMLLSLSYWDRENITKVGEGTYAEAFKVGSNVWKIVPFDGYVQVNGEMQKKSEELLKEVVLARTLNNLRGHGGDVSNACTTFIQTIDLRVCQGCYDSALISAWEAWDAENGSDNDNPKVYPADQLRKLFSVLCCFCSRTRW